MGGSEPFRPIQLAAAHELELVELELFELGFSLGCQGVDHRDGAPRVEAIPALVEQALHAAFDVLAWFAELMHAKADDRFDGLEYAPAVAGGSDELAHDVAVHIAFARPRYLRREDVPADEVEAERQTLETLTINEGKPEQAVPKIVEGRLNGFFKDICLLEQPYAKDDKQSIAQFIGDAEIVRFAQVEIG